MKKFEYKITHGQILSIETEANDLKEMGNEGWELCGVITGKFSIFYYWKREIQLPEPNEPELTKPA